MSGRKLTPLQAMEEVRQKKAGGSGTKKGRVTTKIPAHLKGKTPLVAPTQICRDDPAAAADAALAEVPHAEAAAAPIPRPSKRHLHQVGEEIPEEESLDHRNKKAKTVRVKATRGACGKNKAPAEKGETRGMGVEDLPEDLRDGLAHLLPSFNFMAEQIPLQKGQFFETMSPEDLIVKAAQNQAKLAYLLANNLEILKSTMAEGGQAQRLQSLLTEREQELRKEAEEARKEAAEARKEAAEARKEAAEAKAEASMANERASLRTRERDSARTEIVMKGLEYEKKTDRLQGQLGEKDAALVRAEEELAQVRAELGSSQASFDAKVEEIKTEAKIEGFEESVQVIRTTFPDLDLTELEKLVKFAKGEMTLEEAYGSPLEDPVGQDETGPEVPSLALADETPSETAADVPAADPPPAE